MQVYLGRDCIKSLFWSKHNTIVMVIVKSIADHQVNKVRTINNQSINNQSTSQIVDQ